MARPVSKTPTTAELQVLDIIWEQGPCTLRQIHEALPVKLNRATVFGRLEVMVNKGLLKLEHRSKGEGGSVYLATYTREGMISRLFKQMARLFGGSRRSLLQGLLRAGELDEGELRELRKILKEEKKDRSG